MNGLIQRNSPLTEATYYILISLTEPLHGYGIMKKVDEMSHGRIRLAAGTLYGALNTLLSTSLLNPSVRMKRIREENCTLGRNLVLNL